MEIIFFVVTVVVMTLLVSHDLHYDKRKISGRTDSEPEAVTSKE